MDDGLLSVHRIFIIIIDDGDDDDWWVIDDCTVVDENYDDSEKDDDEMNHDGLVMLTLMTMGSLKMRPCQSCSKLTKATWGEAK